MSRALRLCVVGAVGRVDLVVPAAVTVADLLADELLAEQGGPVAAPADLRLSVLGGVALDPGTGLAEQGVPDGAVLTLTRTVDHLPPPVDDLTAAVAEAVAAVPGPGPDLRARTLAAVAAGLLAAAGAGTAGLVALVVDAPPSAVALAAGTTAVVAASVAARLGPVSAPWWLAAPTVAGVVALVAVVADVAAVPLPAAACAALVAAVVTGDLLPWLAAGRAGLLPPPLGEPPALPEPAAVTAGVRRAHDLLTTAAVAATLLLVLLGPVAALSGPWGAALAVLCGAVVLLRSRRQRVGAGGLVSVVAGLAVLPPVAVTVWTQWPQWRPGLVAVLAVAGALALSVAACRTRPGTRAGRLAEVGETLVLVALPPVLLLATGLLDTLREALP